MSSRNRETQVIDWPTIERVVVASRLTLLYGPPGTGKTTCAHNAARSLNLKVESLTLTDETPSAELRGHYLPGDDGGRWLWQNGPAMTSYLTGSMLVLNELDKASDDCQHFLHGLLDDSSVASMTLPNGETVSPHDDFRVVGTMNGSLDDLIEAVGDRFANAIYVGTPHPDAIAALPTDLQEVAARSIGADTDLDRPVTMRRWFAFANMREAIDAETAAKVVFAHRAQEILDLLTLEGSR